MSPEETADLIEMAFGMWSGVGESNVLDEGMIPPGEETILGDFLGWVLLTWHKVGHVYILYM